jgi:hypothetical protein
MVGSKTEYDTKDLIRRSTKTKSGVFNKRMSDVTDQYIERTRQVVEQYVSFRTVLSLNLKYQTWDFIVVA